MSKGKKIKIKKKTVAKAALGDPLQFHLYHLEMA